MQSDENVDVAYNSTNVVKVCEKRCLSLFQRKKYRTNLDETKQ